MRIILIMLFSIYYFSCTAQTEKYTYINKIKSICPNADIIEIETKDDFIEIEYLCDKQVYEIGLSNTLDILYIETETSIDNSTLYKIQKKIDKKYFGWSIDEFALVKLTDTSFYKVEILHNGIEENIYFTLEGKYYKAKNININESWNIASLEKNELYKKANYNLTRPFKTFEMPEILTEISGIAIINDTEIFCIQDEMGIVFKYNIQKEELSDLLRFTDIGDFEDITIQNQEAHILRSDGTVFSLNYNNYLGEFKSKIIPINCINIEGLFFNEADKKFLIACKEQLITEVNSKRHIFSVDATGSTQPKVEFIIDLDEINTYLKKHYHEINERVIQLNPSAIAVHPITQEIYVLSASNRLLAIYTNGKLNTIYPLAEELFYKPEGISFNNKGDLFIATEGNNKGYTNGQIHFFKYK